MPLIKENDIKKQIKSGEFARVYLIYGEEAYLKSFYAARIAEKAVVKAFTTFNLHKLDGKDTSIYEIYEIAETLPVGGGWSCIIISDMPLNNLSEKDSELFKDLISDIPETTIILFHMNTLDVDPKAKKWSAVIKLISEHGSVLEFGRKKAGDISSLLIKGAEKRGCKLDSKTANYLISVSGSDLNILFNELEKVCAFTACGEISAGDIDKVAVKTVEATAFDLVRALVAKNAAQAFSFLDIMLSQKVQPLMVLGAVISSYVDMYRVKVILSSGGDLKAAAEAFNYRNMDFRLKNAQRNSAGLSIAQLRLCLKELAAADEMLKSSSADSRTILEKTIAKLLLIESGEF